MSQNPKSDSIVTWAPPILKACTIAAYALAGGLAVIMVAGLAAYLRDDTISLGGMIRISPAGDWQLSAYRSMMGAALITALILVLHRLRAIVATLADGDPFIPQNADHVRVIWIIVAGVELGRILLAGVWGLAVAAFNGPSADILHHALRINLKAWFAVLVLMVVAEVFRHGAKLREEQKLTI